MQIVLGYPASDIHRRAIKDRAPSSEVIVSEQGALADEIFSADIFCGHAKVPIDWHAVVERGRLKWIQSSASGLDHCLTRAIIESEILVTGASGLFRHQVAEHTFALLLGLIRGLPTFFRAFVSKEFLRRPTDDLRGKTVGIVGFGGNGQRIAEWLAPVGCRVLATDRFPQEWREACELPSIDHLWPAERLNDLLVESHVVILTLPLLNDTVNLISRDELSLMQPGSYLINVGRGGLVYEDALIESLKSGHLAGAGLDVTASEPLSESSPLWDLPNVLITPHVAAQSRSRYSDVTRLFCDNLERFVAGQKLRNLVDKQVGFPLPQDRF